MKYRKGQAYRHQHSLDHTAKYKFLVLLLFCVWRLIQKECTRSVVAVACESCERNRLLAHLIMRIKK